MPATATFRITIDLATGEVYNFNSAGEAWNAGESPSQNAFKPASFEITRNISSKSVSFTIPRLDDANQTLSLTMLSDVIQTDARVRYSIIINGSERVLLYGRVSDSVIDDAEISITVSSFFENLKYSKVVKLSAICRNRFRDSLCGFDATSITESREIASISADRLAVTFVQVMSINQFQDGTLVLDFTSTGGRVLEQDIAVNDEDTLYLWERLPGLFQVGDTMSMVPGCLKTESSCRGYNNFERFGALPSGVNWSPTQLQAIAGAGE